MLGLSFIVLELFSFFAVILIEISKKSAKNRQKSAKILPFWSKEPIIECFIEGLLKNEHMSLFLAFANKNVQTDAHPAGQDSRDGMNNSIRFEFYSIRTRGPAHLITLNYTLLFMENYKSNCTGLQAKQNKKYRKIPYCK